MAPPAPCPPREQRDPRPSLPFEPRPHAPGGLNLFETYPQAEAMECVNDHYDTDPTMHPTRAAFPTCRQPTTRPTRPRSVTATLIGRNLVLRPMLGLARRRPTSPDDSAAPEARVRIRASLHRQLATFTRPAPALPFPPVPAALILNAALRRPRRGSRGNSMPQSISRRRISGSGSACHQARTGRSPFHPKLV